MLDASDKRTQLAMAFAVAIKSFTSHTPMTIEEILEALAFTAGHALAQKSATTFATKKKLREYVIASLDRGITEGSIDRTKPQVFIAPPRNGG